MRYHRGDVVDRALVVLDRYGLGDLTMRRLASELGVQPSALYHHVPNKQTLLALVADEILARGPAHPRGGAWDARTTAVCTELREAMLAYRDGAEVVATAHAFGLGAGGPGEELEQVLADSGLDAELARVASRTLLHFVFGHVVDEQTHLQAGSAGAIDDAPRQVDDSDFAVGLALVVDGIRARRPARHC
ncbi:TetR/AcrR family transcriptional regulator C-terminal domain-containing protein [Nocardioides ferulae]|uniref:TetR/AcrR family transcriptional regulator C-terminal domain-containing protein n=1 Tax=Nocardioides ferulae TaxID=2340821 RepID=UPI000EAB6B1B|nr:TetR/AcrR family transcriptional regulator C-terminal domain-containing protein [Nocardioides ferulae]